MDLLLRLPSALLLLALAACGGRADSPPERDAPLEPGGSPPAVTATLCDVHEQVLQPSCTGCHNTLVHPMDLRWPGLHERLVEPLVVPGDADASLLVQRMRGQAGDLMPPDGALDDAMIDLVASWIDGGAEDCEGATVPFEPTTPETALSKVKTLLHGGAPSDEELRAVQADPAALRDLVEDWAETPEFEGKLSDFFTTTFQQAQIPNPALVIGQLRYVDVVNEVRVDNALLAGLTESFARTAMTIVADGRPFTEVAHTRRWQLTTALMSWLRASDVVNPFFNTEGVRRPFSNYYEDDPSLYHRFVLEDPAPPPLSEQIATQTWHIPMDCAGVPRQSSDHATLFTVLGGRYFDCDWSDQAVFTRADYADWREVELTYVTDADPEIPFWDVPSLRDTDRLALRIPRAGYFSTPAFLAQWRSNIDNSFRVVTNQALIVGLGAGFDSEDATVPLSSEGLAEEHAEEGTVCYGCHQHLDPMRAFFLNEFDPDSSAPSNVLEDEVPDWVASFAFRGHTLPGDDLVDLGAAIATHPEFAAAWTQKLCYYANAAPCDLEDPEFVRVSEAFAASNFDFRTLIVELFSSPLVTGLEPVLTWERSPFAVSLSRRDHLCPLLETRLGVSNLCLGFGGRFGGSAVAVPADAWGRSKEAPVQTSAPTMFTTAAQEALCREIAPRVVDASGSPLTSRDVPGSVVALVEQVAGLPPSDPRHADLLADLQAHVAEAEGLAVRPRSILQSAFILTCSSPFVAAVGL